ncbi:MAG: DUF6034 family protein [Wujia sp.]
MRKKIYVFATMCTFALALCACGKKEVKYQPDSQATQSDAEDGEEGGNKLEGGLAKSLGVEEKLLESVTTDDGGTIKIFGEVIVPDATELNVYTTTKKSFDDLELRKSIVEKISDDGKIYSAKEENLPAYILTKRADNSKSSIQFWEEEIQNVSEESVKNDYQTYYQEEKENYDRYQNLIANAGDEFVETTYEDWKASEDIPDDAPRYSYYERQVIIMRDGKPWYLMVDQYSGMTLTAVDYRDCFPDKADEFTYIEGGIYKDGVGKVIDDDARATYEEPALEFVRSLGIGEFASQGRLFSTNFYGTAEVDGKLDSKSVGDLNAYILAFSRNLDGVSTDCYNYWSMTTYANVEEANTYQSIEKYPSEEILVCVGADGKILGFNAKGLVETPTVQTQGVELLSFEQVKEIILNQMQTNPPVNGSGWSSQDDNTIIYDPLTNYGNLTLEYFRMPDENDENQFTLIPVWCLKGETTDSYSAVNLLINAMDGSVIDPGKVLFKMEKWEYNEVG